MDNLYLKDKGGYFRTYINNIYYKENQFVNEKATEEDLPCFENIKHLLPMPIWEDHDESIKCYFKAWELAFCNLKKPSFGSGFISNYINPLFNGNVFMWDTVFMLMFGLYGIKAFDFQQSLNNFYKKQHPDGFICREISESTGDDLFHRYDPSSTGPNLLAWSEYAYYCFTGDIERLAKVFPVIAGYHQWFRNYRTWQDKSYYSSGWGCGMDNQPRIRGDYPFEFFHGFMSWIDITMQQLFSAYLIVKMSEILNKRNQAQEFEEEREHLYKLVNEKMWDEKKYYYFDKYADGTLSDVMSIGSYWALLANAVPSSNVKGFISHLKDANEFNRPHRIPSLAADNSYYKPSGNYWCGSVWSPTNYMVLKGLEMVGENALAREIALNHYSNVLKVFINDGAFYENYAPEYAGKGSMAVKDFVGWTGLSVINILFEFIFGIKPDFINRTIVWEVNITDEHGVENYPFGKNEIINLICRKRNNIMEEPMIEIKSNDPILLKVRWGNNEKIIHS